MFSETLKALRLYRGETQKQAAEACKIAQSSWACYEKGLRVPNYSILSQIADHYAVSVEFLMDAGEETTLIRDDGTVAVGSVKAIQLKEDSPSKIVEMSNMRLFVEDESMLPLFQIGDELMVEYNSKEFFAGKPSAVVAVNRDGFLLCRPHPQENGGLILSFDNPSFSPPICFTPEEMKEGACRPFAVVKAVVRKMA